MNIMHSSPLSPPHRALQSLNVSERPQERLERLGANALSDAELLAMLLRSGSAQQDVLSLSQNILKEAGSLKNLLRWSANDFARFNGIGKVKSLQLTTVLEIARRSILAADPNEIPEFDSSDKVYQFMQARCAGVEVEKFWVLILNRKNKLISLHEVSSGIASATLVHPREVYREAIRQGASAIIAVHNHPSGQSDPSIEDHKVTDALQEAGRVLQIELLDHVIIGNNNHYSYADHGLV